ncbi:MAG: hypothetical protein IAG10_35560 [Planctomycetaceae bacterium]|nr:hypothetical protein [Planctomycetaceae bacterium]
MASRLSVALKKQALLFLDEPRLRALQSELRDDFVKYSKTPLSDSRRGALLVGIDGFVAEHFRRDERDHVYLHFRDEFDTLKWQLRIAANHVPLTSADLARREQQRKWMVNAIEALPESPKFGIAHKDELAKLDRLLNDPLNAFLAYSMSEPDFARFQKTFDERVKNVGAGTSLTYAVSWLTQAAIETQIDSLLREWPVKNRGWHRSNTRWSLKVTPRVGNSSLDLMDVSTNVRDVYADVLQNIFVNGDAPVDFDQRDEWLLKQPNGDLCFDAKLDLLMGVRGAKLAVLDAASWYEADRVPLADLRRLIETRGQVSIPLSNFAEPKSPEGPYRRLKSHHPSLVVRTGSNRISVIRLRDVDSVIIVSRPRPLPPNPPLHPGDEPDEPSTAKDDPKQKRNVVELPGGVRLELCGVLNGNVTTPAAWRPDGTKIDVPKAWPELRRTRNEDPTHGFVFRANGLAKGQSLIWSKPGRWTTPVFGETVPEYLGISTRVPDEERLNIRVGITDVWGPWQRVEPNGEIKERVKVPDGHRSAYDRVKSTRVFGSDTGELKTGFVLEGIVETDDQAEYEVVAVGPQGTRHKGRGVGIWKDSQIPYFEESIQQIDHFEFRLQPHRHWVTFENVSLQPGKTTDVKVKVESNTDERSVRQQVDAIVDRFAVAVRRKAEFLDEEQLAALRHELREYLLERVARPVSEDWMRQVLRAVELFVVDVHRRPFEGPTRFMTDFEILKWHVWTALDRDELTPEQLALRESQQKWFREFARTLPDPSGGKVGTWLHQDGSKSELTTLAFKLKDLDEMMTDPLNPYFAWPFTEKEFQTIQTGVRKQKWLFRKADLTGAINVVFYPVAEQQRGRVSKRWPIKRGEAAFDGFWKNLFQWDSELAKRPLSSLKKAPPQDEEPLIPNPNVQVAEPPKVSTLEPMQGEVIDAVTGKPIEGATVRFRFGKLQDGLRSKGLAELVFRNVGRFTFELPDAVKGQTDLFVERTAEHPDYQTSGPGAVPLHLLFNKNPNHAHDFIRKVELVPGKIVTGLVLDLNGQPAKGVEVFSGRNRQGWGNGNVHRTTTDANGRYRLAVPNSERGRVYVIPNHAAAVSRAITPEFGEQPVFQLLNGTRLFGRATDAQGRGVANVVMRADGGERVPWRYAMTDADGKYSLPPCQYGTYTVELMDEGWMPDTTKRGARLSDVFVTQKVELPKTATTQRQLDFKPADSVRVTTRFTTADDQPVSGRSLTLQGSANGVTWWGKFRDIADQPGHYELRVPRGSEGRIHQDVEDNHFLRIVGEAADSATTSQWHMTKFDKDGFSYHVRQLKAGSVTLRATHNGQPVKIAGSLATPQFADPDAARAVGARTPSHQFRHPTTGELWFDAHPDIDLLLKLEVPGFKPWQQTVRIPEGKDQVIDVPLEVASQPGPVEKKPGDDAAVAAQKRDGLALTKIVSVNVKGQTLEQVLADICRQAGLTLDLDKKELDESRLLWEIPLIDEYSDEVHGPLEFVLIQLFNPALAFEVEGQTLRVSSRSKIQKGAMLADRIDLAKLAESVGPTLKCLNLREMRVADDDLKQLAKFPKLERLSLLSTAIRDAGLEHVVRLESLVQLDVGGFITDAGLKRLSKSRSIRQLSLIDAQITDAAAESLVAMPQLESLTLQWTRFGDAGLKQLAAADRLKRLSAESSTFTDAGVEALASCKRLESLGLLGEELTVACLKPLETMTGLRELPISFPNQRQEDLKALRTALSKTKVRDFSLSVASGSRCCDGFAFDANTGAPIETLSSQFGRPDPVTGETQWEPPHPRIISNMTGRFAASNLQAFRKFRLIADGYEPVDLTPQLREANDPRRYEKLTVKMRRTSN